MLSPYVCQTCTPNGIAIYFEPASCLVLLAFVILNNMALRCAILVHLAPMCRLTLVHVVMVRYNTIWKQKFKYFSICEFELEWKLRIIGIIERYIIRKKLYAHQVERILYPWSQSSLPGSALNFARGCNPFFRPYIFRDYLLFLYYYSQLNCQRKTNNKFSVCNKFL